jgi:hypothetical protein
MEEQQRSVLARGRSALGRLRRGKAGATEGKEAKSTDGETSPDSVNDVPNIGEKVRFWEEQDRINKELIPRVIKQHELLTKHIEGHQDATSVIAAMEARFLKRQRLVLALAGAALMVGVVSLILGVVI